MKPTAIIVLLGEKHTDVTIVLLHNFLLYWPDETSQKWIVLSRLPDANVLPSEKNRYH